MAVGGWSGDPVPTLQQFIDDVHAGKISYYVEAGRGPNSPAAHGEVIRSTLHTASHTREIADWVAANYPGMIDRRIDGLPLVLTVTMRMCQVRGTPTPPPSIRRSQFPMLPAPTPAPVGCPAAST